MAARSIIAAAATCTLIACAPPVEQQQRVNAPAIRVVGEAQNCLTTRLIESTTVHDDYTIDFHLPGGRTYRNTLSRRCYSLGFEERFAYETSTAQICGQDVIRVVFSDGRTGATCALGQFLPVEIIED